MKSQAKPDKLTVKDGWLHCPMCRRNKKLLRIEEDTEAYGLPVYCTYCKREIILNIARGQRVELQSP